MKRDDLLKTIAEKGYDVGFGAKKHFATYDITGKIPGVIGFLSLSFGILALAIKDLSTALISAIFIILGVIGIYINAYESDKEKYEKSGKELTQLFNKLKELYLEVKSLDDSNDLSEYIERLQNIDKDYYSTCISKQILFCSWYAHYKFFWEHQIGWIDEQLNFNFFRDKVPLTLWIFIAVLTFILIINFTHFFTYICQISTS